MSRLQVRKSQHQVRLERDDLVDVGAGESRDARLFAPRPRRTNRKSGDPHDARFLTQEIQRLRSFFGETDDAFGEHRPDLAIPGSPCKAGQMLSFTQRLEDGLYQRSRRMAAPWGPVLRLLRFPAAITRDWLAGEINVRAMSLAYTTLLSLVPLMVFSFSILKGLGARGNLHYLLHQFFRPLGAASSQLTESVMQFVTNMRGDVLGSLGLGFLVYTVITTIQKVEASFNFRLARRASAQLRPPLHRVFERDDSGSHSARRGDRHHGIRLA